MKIISFLSLIFIFCIVAISCKKNTNTNSTNTSTPPTPIISPPIKDSGINNNVYVIDSTMLTLNPDSNLLNAGKFEYTFSGSAPELKTNDIIVGATNGGYIRKISAVNKQSNKINLETTQGNMEDVFKNASFNIKTGMDNLKPARVLSGYQFDVSGQTIYQDGSVTIKLDKGVINMDGDWNFGFDFKNSKLNTFDMGCKNATFNGDFNLNISASKAATIAEKTSTLARVAKYNIFFVGAVPVVLYTEVELRCVFSATINASSQGNYLVNTNNTADIGINYLNSQWQNNFTNNSKSTLSVVNGTSNVGVQIKMGIVPYISFRLYRVLGPYFSLGLQEQVDGNVATPSLDWDFTTSAWIQAVGGVRANIVGTSLFDFNKEWNSDKLFYKTPFSVIKISGDNQTGTTNQYLSQPLKLRVLDNNNNPQSNVSVIYAVTAGGGSMEKATVLTDKDGYVETLWKLGSQFGIQTVTATVKKADGSLIQNAPIEFAATISQTIPSISTSTTSSITQTTAASGGNITNDGGSPITARGVCWSITANPTIANNKTIDGTGTGSFTSNIAGLTANTTYHVRSYATTSIGTAYGSDVTFTTINLPTLTTRAVSNIATNSVTSGGNIINDGGAPITARGVCWSITANPTITNNKTNDGIGIGIFTSTLTGLTGNTTYYVKAYATNNSGTSYGNEMSFITLQSDSKEIVTLGTQTWMTRNLDVVTYRNGDLIPQITDAGAWSNLTTGAWCYYKNDPTNGATYGKLYNWYAVNDPRGLAPKGWHIPTAAAYDSLASYLGGIFVAGGKLKTTNFWDSPNTGATNSSGFSAVPSGYRDKYFASGTPQYTFTGLNMYCIWWTSTESIPNQVSVCFLRWDAEVCSIGNSAYDDFGKKEGYSVRCVKD